MWKEESPEKVEAKLQDMGMPDLKLMAHELGLSFASKQSCKVLVSGIIGRVNESLMLSRNTNLTQPRSFAIDVAGGDLETGLQVGEPLTGHQEAVRGALLLPDGKHALSWSWDRTLRRWDLETGLQVGEPLTGHQDDMRGALLLPDGRHALSWSWDRTLRAWDLAALKELGCFYAEGKVTAIVDCGMNRLFVGDDVGRVYFLELTRC
jgi:WD40 repeat protein